MSSLKRNEVQYTLENLAQSFLEETSTEEWDLEGLSGYMLDALPLYIKGELPNDVDEMANKIATLYLS